MCEIFGGLARNAGMRLAAALARQECYLVDDGNGLRAMSIHAGALFRELLVPALARCVNFREPPGRDRYREYSALRDQLRERGQYICLHRLACPDPGKQPLTQHSMYLNRPGRWFALPARGCASASFPPLADHLYVPPAHQDCYKSPLSGGYHLFVQTGRVSGVRRVAPARVPLSANGQSPRYRRHGPPLACGRALPECAEQY